MKAGSRKVGEWEGYRLGEPEAAQSASGPRACRLTLEAAATAAAAQWPAASVDGGGAATALGSPM